jgi:hypothetical protein
MKNALTQIMTGDDDITFDLLKVLALVSVVVGLALQIAAALWPDRFKFDMQAYGIGLGAVFLAVGGALRLQAPSTSVTATSTTTVTETKP